MKRKHPELPDRYDAFLQELKERIRGAQVRAALSVNRELVLLYWRVWRAKAQAYAGLCRRTPTINLCNRSLHNCPGDTMSEFLKW